MDVTERRRTGNEAARARRRLTLIADASLRIGTTLDLEQTAREPAEVCVPDLAVEVGGDWFDAIPLAGDKTALVVGDVMGSGINAAATMGRLRTATRAYADLDLSPTEILERLDHTTTRLEEAIATCAYAVHDPHRARCRISLAGHLPPALVRPGRAPQLLDLPTGAPLGVGGIPFQTTPFDLGPGDRLVLYTDGLVETRDQAVDQHLNTLLGLLDDPERPLEETCDRLLHALRRPDDHDDVALLVAQVRPLPDHQASRP
ncbi:hypothetical protein GCM10010405_43090 [Streptomyces macrosporus]|uniref:PPM-type phosphatase domain-containing protein n=1 Tax=Streptomyces macrosporus TaxID=44032 RepID=A0ABP5XFK1_9ACTN